MTPTRSSPRKQPADSSRLDDSQATLSDGASEAEQCHTNVEPEGPIVHSLSAPQRPPGLEAAVAGTKKRWSACHIALEVPSPRQCPAPTPVDSQHDVWSASLSDDTPSPTVSPIAALSCPLSLSLPPTDLTTPQAELLRRRLCLFNLTESPIRPSGRLLSSGAITTTTSTAAATNDNNNKSPGETNSKDEALAALEAGSGSEFESEYESEVVVNAEVESESESGSRRVHEAPEAAVQVLAGGGESAGHRVTPVSRNPHGPGPQESAGSKPPDGQEPCCSGAEEGERTRWSHRESATSQATCRGNLQSAGRLIPLPAGVNRSNLVTWLSPPNASWSSGTRLVLWSLITLLDT
ncbi:unnamed protein product [Protopolystoma xenopodis]|uniref:Uncharacterized protein n=1 Tax=Protopolystoma xenopodis TaxID=117903 RepID=A0A448WK85_9PLAT|nr:unnamed protein product [Protopolystoma xenopodis]